MFTLTVYAKAELCQTHINIRSRAGSHSHRQHRWVYPGSVQRSERDNESVCLSVCQFDCAFILLALQQGSQRRGKLKVTGWDNEWERESVCLLKRASEERRRRKTKERLRLAFSSMLVYSCRHFVLQLFPCCLGFVYHTEGCLCVISGTINLLMYAYWNVYLRV